MLLKNNFLTIATITVITLMLPIKSNSEPLHNKCESGSQQIEKKIIELKATLEKTKTYVEKSPWINSLKQLEINGHWKDLDLIIETIEVNNKKLSIINEEGLCEEFKKESVKNINYIIESNTIIRTEIDNTISNAKNIVETTKCNSQSSCNGYFSFFLQKNLNDIAFSRYSVFLTNKTNLELVVKKLPPVNLNRKELILY